MINDSTFDQTKSLPSTTLVFGSQISTALTSCQQARGKFGHDFEPEIVTKVVENTSWLTKIERDLGQLDLLF
jgi:hypothetical protein